MKPTLILVSHGLMAQETLRSAEMITGSLPNATAVCMTEQDGLSGFVTKMQQTLVGIGEDVQVLVVADLYGGTPCNAVTANFLTRSNLRLVTGLNLAMILEYAGSGIDDIDELAELLAQIGKIGIRQVTPLNRSDDTDDDDEVEG